MEATIPGLEFDLIPSISIVLVSVCMVAVLASSEAAILSVNRIRIKNLEQNGDKRAKAISDLLRTPDKLFATILATENAFIIFASSVGATLAHKMFGASGTLIASFIMTLLIVIFGEITPKTFAAQNSEKLSLFASIPLKTLVTILNYPMLILTGTTKLLISSLNKLGIGQAGAGDLHSSVTEGEIRMIIDDGPLHQQERELLQNVFDFGDTVVAEVMVPRTEIKALQKDYTIKEALMEMLHYKYSKFPVYDNSLDEIVGIVYLKELLDFILNERDMESETIEKLAKPAIFVPESKQIGEVLRLMKKRKTQIFIVADEYGGTDGLITVQDILEPIVGEMEEDINGFVEEKEFETVDENTFVLKGTTSIHDIKEQINISLPEGNYTTIAGFILQKLGKIPTAGEKFVHNELEIIVSEVVGPKILKVTITKN